MNCEALRDSASLGLGRASPELLSGDTAVPHLLKQSKI